MIEQNFALHLFPLGELLWEGASFAVGEVLQAEVVVKLEEGLLMSQAAQEWAGCGLVTEQADRSAFEFLVGRGVADFVVIFEGETFFVKGERDEVVGGEFQSQVFSKYGDGGLASV